MEVFPKTEPRENTSIFRDGINVLKVPRPHELSSPGYPDAQTQSRQALHRMGGRSAEGRCLMGQDKLRACSPSQTFSPQPGLLGVGDTVSSRLLRLPPWKPSVGTSATAYMTATFSLYQMRPRDPITALTPTFQGALWTQAFPGGRVHMISLHPAL